MGPTGVPVSGQGTTNQLSGGLPLPTFPVSALSTDPICASPATLSYPF